MVKYIQGAALIFVLWVAYKQGQNWLRWRALKEFGDKNGCGDAPVFPNKLPWGVERLFFLLRGGLKGIDFLEDLIRANFRKMACNTYRVHGMFNRSFVTTCEPENIQALLATKFNDFDIGTFRKRNLHELLGNGIFTAEGEAWSHYRNQLRPQFTRDQVSNLEEMDRHLQILLRALPDESSRGWIESVDIQPFLYRFTMDVSTEFLFGESVNSQLTFLHSQDSGNTKDMQKDMDFAEAINFAQEYITWRLRLFGPYYMYSSSRFKTACKIVKDFGDHFVRIALSPDRKHTPVSAGQKQKFVMLDAMVAETKDPIELRDQILHLLLAGRDTTSALLSWTILLLARHTQEFDKLRRTVLEHFGTESEPMQELTFTSMKACKAITHCLYEAMRLYPLLPVNVRMALRDTFLPIGGGPDGKQPLAIMKGEQVGYSSYVMHRRADIWGSDADEFHPERWEGRKLGWEYIPFSGGPRVCLGQQFALNEASFVIVKLLQKFDHIEALDQKPIVKSFSLALSPANGAVIKMHRAGSQAGPG